MTKQKRDWVGGNAAVFKTIGASNHGNEPREQHDYYATDPRSVEALLKVEQFASHIWEPACGEGNISHTLMAHGYEVRESDIIDRMDNEVKDFLFFNDELFDGDIVTNPPYSLAKEFVEQSLKVIPEGRKVAMFLKLTFLEGKGRRELFRIAPPEPSTCLRSGKCALKTMISPSMAWRVPCASPGLYGRKVFRANPKSTGFKKAASVAA